MKTPTTLLLLAAIAATSFAAPALQQPSASATKYHEFRQQITLPAYGLAKVQRLVKGLKMDNNEQDALNSKLYNKLSFKEKFTYTMIHGDVSDQNCDGMPFVIDEDKKIFGHPPDTFNDETGWGPKQTAFLNQNRSKVIGLLRETMKLRGSAGTNFKQAVLQLDAVELIPDLTRVFNLQRKDFDILTVMMLLMEKHKFGPFVTSETHKKLYGPNANYQSFILGNVPNQKLTLARAAAFYKSRK